MDPLLTSENENTKDIQDCVGRTTIYLKSTRSQNKREKARVGDDFLVHLPKVSIRLQFLVHVIISISVQY